jgi:alpha-ketoglutarate-dependent taurine dioxygenase
MTEHQLDICKVTPHCGAELRGIDLSQPLDQYLVDALAAALAEHCVLFFHGQDLTHEQHKGVWQYLRAGFCSCGRFID